MKGASLVKGLGWSLFLNILIKPVWIFGIDRQVQNTVGHEAYGTYFALLNLSIILSFLADFGLSNVTNLKLATGEGVNIKSLLRFKFGLSFIYLTALFSVAAISGIKEWTILLLVALIQLLTSFFVLMRSIITAQQLFTTDAWLSVFDKALMILICATFLYLPLFPSISIIFFLSIQLGCTLLAVLIAAGIILQKKLFSNFQNGGKSKYIAKGVLPFAAVILLMATHNRLDGFLLERLHPQGAVQAGIYAAAYRLLDAGNMVGYLFASFLVPFIARHQQDKTMVEKTILVARHFLIISSGIALFFILIYAAEVQRLLYVSTNAFSIQVVQLCMGALPAYMLVHLYGSLLTAINKLYAFISLLAICVVINAVLNIFFIPVYGAAGCAVAAIVSQYVCGFGALIVASYQYEIRYKVKSLLYCLVSILAAALLFYAAKYFNLHPLLVITTVVIVLSLLLFAYIPFLKKHFLLSR
jgi:O-antigen/teichoic acid export membrane protein